MEKIKYNKKLLKYFLVGFIILEFLLLFTILISNAMIIVIISVLVCGIISLILFYYYKIKLPFKTEVVKGALEKFKSGLIYCYKGFNKDYYINVIKEFKLIPAATAFQFQDAIIDEINGFKYCSYDLLATHTQSTGKTTTVITDFKGKVYDVTVPKNHCNYVLKEEFWKTKLDGYDLLDTELIDFNKALNLYVNDKFEAQKIFTPSTIENYLALINKYEDTTNISYIDDHLYILIKNNENQFESMESESIIIDEFIKQYNILSEYVEILVKTVN